MEFNQIHPGETIDCCLDPQLNRLKSYSDDTKRPIKELLEFPPREIFLPHLSYRNLLYIYPLSLNLSNLTTRGSTSARNIAVKIQLMGAEEEIFALPVIFGKSSGQEMIKEVYLPVLYHSKSLDFCFKLNSSCHRTKIFFYLELQHFMMKLKFVFQLF